MQAKALLELGDLGLGQVLHLQAKDPRIAADLQPPLEVVDVGLDVLHLVVAGDLVAGELHQLGDVVPILDGEVDGHEVVVGVAAEHEAGLQVGLKTGEGGHNIYKKRS